MEIIFVILFLAALAAFLHSNKDKFKINRPEPVVKTNIDFTFTFPIDREKVRKLHNKLMEAGDIKTLQAVRLVEIIFDSLYIVRTTRNIETAKSRLDLASNNYIELQLESPDIAHQIKAQYLEWKNEGTNLMYINAADELAKKSKKVKMQKTKDKYIQNAIQILEDGLLNGADSGLLLQEIEKLKNNV
ncbi:hypothetical protein [Campylobacter sp. RM16191]|uniref:hypothetical protein n=1 Tax=Campylobacter sp. RM16191 TaxID=1705728 RepID=UPI001473F3E4|nr:hypothetical protein [Campylobacter sp. RM16191]